MRGCQTYRLRVICLPASLSFAASRRFIEDLTGGSAAPCSWPPEQIFSHYDHKLQAFLDFVLFQYVKEGVGELDQAKLPHLLELKYRAVSDAATELGGVAHIRDAFIGFQRHLYDG
jgi:hypothetical protein